MACCLFGAKPLPELTWVYCQLDTWEQISVSSIIFIQENVFEIVIC